MPDFGGLFSQLSNPDMQRMLAMVGGEIGKEMSPPGTFGSAAGRVASMMAQGGAMKKEMVTASTPTPVAPTAPAETPPTDPLEAARHMKSYGKLIEDAFKIDPTLKPTGFDGAFGSALTAAPPPIAPASGVGGTAPVATPAPAAAPTPAAPVVTPNSLSDMGAMTIGPQGVGQVFAQGTAAGTLDLARQKQRLEADLAPAHKEYLAATTRHLNSTAALEEWKATPEGRKVIQENAIALAGAPSVAAAAADEVKTKFAMSQIELLPAAVRDTKVAGTGYTMGQIMRLGILSPHGTSALASMEDAKVRAEVSRTNNQAIIDERKERKEQSEVDVAIKQIQAIDTQINTLIKKQSAEELASDPAALSLAKAMGNLRSADTDKQIKDLQTQKKMLSTKVPGWIYSEIPTDAGEVKLPVVKREDLGKRLKALPTTSATTGNVFNNSLNPGSPAMIDNYNAFMQ
uniref:Uncharacterized protein n=1 Tax=viral metagenome TaxID=1070528 RepID=A0A6M3JCW0_9ZZZZ